MSYSNEIITSLRGRRIGLQPLSSSQSGGSRGAYEYLVGPEALRQGVATSETTDTNMNPFGISRITGTSAASSSVFTLDPPVPGVEKTLYFTSTGNIGCYVKTANDETIHTTLGSSHTTILSTIGGVCKLIGVSTSVWAGLGITSGTSSQAGGFQLTTST